MQKQKKYVVRVMRWNRQAGEYEPELHEFREEVQAEHFYRSTCVSDDTPEISMYDRDGNLMGRKD